MSAIKNTVDHAVDLIRRLASCSKISPDSIKSYQWDESDDGVELYICSENDFGADELTEDDLKSADIVYGSYVVRAWIPALVNSGTADAVPRYRLVTNGRAPGSNIVTHHDRISDACAYLASLGVATGALYDTSSKQLGGVVLGKGMGPRERHDPLARACRLLEQTRALQKVPGALI